MANTDGQPGGTSELERGLTRRAIVSDGEWSAAAERKIAELAYSYWEARGYQGGSPWEDWFRAEHELRERSEL